MLQQLIIRQFAIVTHAEIDLASGMTTITGETGAGKSIAVDALGLCLGNRAEAAMVRPGADKAEITALFSVDSLPEARQWLSGQQLDSDNECILRRVVSSEGRSRAYINGQPVPLQQLRELGEKLVSIHGQHAHQSLLKPEQQLSLLDQYANHDTLLSQTADRYNAWKTINRQIAELSQQQSQREARRQLLQYQVEELDHFALEQGEFEQLEQEHRRLANGADLLQTAQGALYRLYEADRSSILTQLRQLGAELAQAADTDPDLKPSSELLNEAQIQLEEASNELRSYQERIELDPERLAFVESRLDTALTLARKHQIKPDQLVAHHETLCQELSGLNHSDAQLEQLVQEQQSMREAYLEAALALSSSRQQAAGVLAKQVTAQIRKLNMPKGEFGIQVSLLGEDKGNHKGVDEVLFQVTANPGQPLQPIGKVASGGELSRISLALQVLTSDRRSTPTLIFDEVDVGISGGTAAVVGKLLRQLGERNQVMCVTHLPQVAAAGHQQLNVTKFSDDASTETRIIRLAAKERIKEIARMLGGDQITKTAMANAEELLMEA